jgi:hypothetical protein
MPSSNAPVTATMPMSTPTRPIAATRQRRAESFRSIHSMTSEESSSYGPPTPSFLPRPPVPFQTPLSFQSPAYPVTSPAMEPEVPTALLDLDFVILRANASFQQIMADDRDLTRTRLHEIAAPADSESFMSIRTRLRGEREARQPSYLPPIVSSGEDPLGGVLDRDVESLTRGFSDHTYQWIQLKPGPRDLPCEGASGKSCNILCSRVSTEFPPHRASAATTTTTPARCFTIFVWSAVALRRRSHEAATSTKSHALGTILHVPTHRHGPSTASTRTQTSAFILTEFPSTPLAIPVASITSAPASTTAAIPALTTGYHRLLP